MKLPRRHSASVNAGSMADIAFLLLIFFLITTTISADKGILRQLPPECPTGIDCGAEIPERNLLQITLNDMDEIFVQENIVELDELARIVEAFVDNNGKSHCTYCLGNQLPEASDDPKKAVISLSHDALTSYTKFIRVQDEITTAYYKLRSRYALQFFNKTPEQLNKAELKSVKTAYPFLVSEVNVK